MARLEWSRGGPTDLNIGEDPISLLIASPDGRNRTPEGDEVAELRGSESERSTLEIAFVNNMPDPAFDETEQQFIALLERATKEIGRTTVRFNRYGLPGLARGQTIKRRLANEYCPVGDIYKRRPDGLIVTGTEPLTEDLRNETYWDALSELIIWAERSTSSALLSCLAAHAAALLFDGIERQTLPGKCSGVFVQAISPDHPLTEGLDRFVHVPHSRLNDLPSDLLQASGYSNLIESPEMTWTLAVKERGSCIFVLVQGHPEYSTTSLLREYRRDLQRFLRGERDTIPAIPVGYLDETSRLILERFEAKVLDCPTCLELMNDFPFELVAQNLVNTWQDPGTRLYANWLRQIQRRRQRRA